MLLWNVVWRKPYVIGLQGTIDWLQALHFQKLDRNLTVKWQKKTSWPERRQQGNNVMMDDNIAVIAFVFAFRRRLPLWGYSPPPLQTSSWWQMWPHQGIRRHQRRCQISTLEPFIATMHHHTQHCQVVKRMDSTTARGWQLLLSVRGCRRSSMGSTIVRAGRAKYYSRWYTSK